MRSERAPKISLYETNQAMTRSLSRQSGWAGEVGYSTASMTADLVRLRDSWRYAQRNRERTAIFSFLASVFELVAWWAFEKKAKQRAVRALALKKLAIPRIVEPYAALIVASVAPECIDKRTVSKWSRALRYADACKPRKKKLRQFIKEKGGINACATAYSRRFRR
jgi:hypothetical protein